MCEENWREKVIAVGKADFISSSDTSILTEEHVP